MRKPSSSSSVFITTSLGSLKACGLKNFCSSFLHVASRLHRFIPDKSVLALVKPSALQPKRCMNMIPEERLKVRRFEIVGHNGWFDNYDWVCSIESRCNYQK
jgi:hypothetical protein